ncbi:MAG: ABC transporter ATP-binding protein, partial [Thermoplasmata archaeon]|nr:ABC transporter ATP-binding protein [Thermoplasmata archaeon]
RMLTTLSPPTEGTIEIDGRPVSGMDDPVKGQIGIVQQHIALDRDVTVEENIRYHAILHRMSRADTDRRMAELVSMMGLEPYMDRLVINLSGGWKRRVAIVCSMIHDPSILFLDEPTAGLDTQSRHMLWELIRRLNAAGKTVFVTTHYMDEAEELCDRVAIIDHGKIVRCGTPEELRDSIGKWAVEYREDGAKRYRYFADWEESRRFQDSLPRDAAVVSRATNLEDVFLELTGRDVQATEEVRYRV